MFTDSLMDAGEVRVRLSSGPAHGPPLLFLHGVTRRGRDFAPLFPALTVSWHAHLMDHRGHGGSGRTPGAYRVTDYTRDAAAVVRSLGPDPVVLFGHSLGAVVAAAVAAAEPDRVRAVVLEEPPSAGFVEHLDRTPYHALFSAVRRLAESGKSVPELARDLAEIRLPLADRTTVRLGDTRDASALRFYAAGIRDLDPAVVDPPLDGTWFDGFDEAAVWAGVKCPVLLLRGESARGGMLPEADADRMAAALADGARVDVPGVGHLIHWQDTEQTVRLALGFLESV